MVIVTFRLERTYINQLKAIGIRNDHSLSKTVRRILI